MVPSAVAAIGGWTPVLGCHTRALAVFRVVLGGLLVLELVLRVRVLHAFYADEGTLPRSLLMERVDNVYKVVCWHCHFGQVWQQQVLLGLQVAVAACFTLGVQTRLAAVASWYLYLSLTLRNTWMSYILDRYFHYLLFLSMFLPLDQAYSWSGNSSSKKKKKSTKQQQRGAGGGWYVSPATVALKCLVLWIYWDAGYGKYTDPLGGWSYSADPLPALDTYARHTLVAQYLYALVGPSGLRIMTPVVVWVELLAAPVALLGAYLGSPALVYTAIALIVSLHVGIALTLRNAALLSFVACAAWCGFLPFDLGSRPNNSNKKAAAPRVVTWSSRSTTLLSLVLIGSMVAGSLWLETISNACDQSVKHIWSTLLHNRWNVFVGAETYVTWEIAPGQLQDGSIVDVWGRRDTVDWSLPGGGAPCTATARPGRWRSFPYLAGLQGEEGDALWRYLCNEWDRENKVDEANPGRKLIKYNFFMLQADVLPEMQFSATRKRLIQSYDCVPPEEAAVAEDVVQGNKEKEESIPRGELSESKHPDAPNEVESNEPEVPRESDVPTEEPEFIDPDRSEPVPGPDMPGDGNEEEETIPAGEPSETVQPDTPTEMESNEPEVPRESGVPTDEPEFVDPDRSEPVPDMQGDEL